MLARQRGARRVGDLQAFHKRFSGLVRALPPEPAGADAWRATTYGHGVLQTNPLGSALDQESPNGSPRKGVDHDVIRTRRVSGFDAALRTVAGR